MDIRFLDSFVAVMDCGSIAGAARRLNLSAAGVTQRLRALESSLGHPLVARVGRTVGPTASGLAILPHARAMIEQARDLRAIAARDEPAGQIRVGATASSLTGLMPGIIARVGARYPRIEYFIRPGASADLYQAVHAGDLDAALIVKPQFAIPKSMGWRTLRREPLVLIAPRGTRLDDPHRVIRSHRFIRYDRNQWGGQIVDRYLTENGLKVSEWLELDALDAIAALVDRGLGVAILPDWSPPWPAGLRLETALLKEGGTRHTGVLWNIPGPRITAVNAFVQACQEQG